MADWTRKLTWKRITAIGGIVVAGALSACMNDNAAPSQPLAAPSAASYSRDLSAQDAFAQGLLWEKPRNTATSASKVISSKGGNIDVPGTGMQLQVPRGAVSSDTRFTITALPGNVVAYDFEPHGTFFPVPLKFVQHLDQTNFAHVHLPPGFSPTVEGAYFVAPSLIDQSSGVAQVQELIPADSEWSFSGNSITFPIHHFSGYMISMGRGGR